MNAALVLMYHRVCDADPDPFGLCVSPARFAEQMEVLSRTTRPVHLGELLLRAQRGEIPPRCVAVTFDDGYADNLLNARPILERYGVPATVFVTAGSLGAGREFWWDELGRIVLQTPTLPDELFLRVGNAVHHRPLAEASPAVRGRLLLELWGRLLPLPTLERRLVLDRLRRWAGDVPQAREGDRHLTPHELHALVRDGLVEVGAHTMSHPALDLLAPPQQAWEIRESRRRLQEILGRAVSLLSFPHGRHTEHTLRAAHHAGIRGACTTEPALVPSGVHPLRIPRMMAWNWNGTEMARHLAGWFTPQGLPVHVPRPPFAPTVGHSPAHAA